MPKDPMQQAPPPGVMGTKKLVNTFFKYALFTNFSLGTAALAIGTISPIILLAAVGTGLLVGAGAVAKQLYTNHKIKTGKLTSKKSHQSHAIFRYTRFASSTLLLTKISAALGASLSAATNLYAIAAVIVLTAIYLPTKKAYKNRHKIYNNARSLILKDLTALPKNAQRISIKQTAQLISHKLNTESIKNEFRQGAKKPTATPKKPRGFFLFKSAKIVGLTGGILATSLALTGVALPAIPITVAVLGALGVGTAITIKHFYHRHNKASKSSTQPNKMSDRNVGLLGAGITAGLVATSVFFPIVAIPLAIAVAATIATAVIVGIATKLISHINKKSAAPSRLSLETDNAPKAAASSQLQQTHTIQHTAPRGGKGGPESGLRQTVNGDIKANPTSRTVKKSFEPTISRGSSKHQSARPIIASTTDNGATKSAEQNHDGTTNENNASSTPSLGS